MRAACCRLRAQPHAVSSQSALQLGQRGQSPPLLQSHTRRRVVVDYPLSSPSHLLPPLRRRPGRPPHAAGRESAGSGLLSPYMRPRTSCALLRYEAMTDKQAIVHLQGFGPIVHASCRAWWRRAQRRERGTSCDCSLVGIVVSTTFSRDGGTDLISASECDAVPPAESYNKR